MATVDVLAGEVVAAGANRAQRLRELGRAVTALARAVSVQSPGALTFDQALAAVNDKMLTVIATRNQARLAAEAAVLADNASALDAAADAADIDPAPPVETP